MLDLVIFFLVYGTEAVISYVFFSNLAQKKYSAVKTFLYSIMLFAWGVSINIIFHNNIFINLVIFTLIDFIYARIAFRITYRGAIFSALILTAIAGLMEFVSIFLVSALTGSAASEYNNNFSLVMLECLISKILYFIAVIVLTRLSGERHDGGKLPVILFVYPVSCMGCICIFRYIGLQGHISTQIQFVLAAASLILSVSSMILFATWYEHINQENELLGMKSELLRIEKEKAYYDILDRQNQQLMIYAHDAKNHLAAMQRLSGDPKLNEYISKMSERLQDYTKSCHSGNMMLDVMVDKYVSEAQIHGIGFTYEVRACNFSQMDDLDLVAVFGNLMDNAMTAAEKSSEKRLTLETGWRNNYSVAVIRNSCDTKPETKKGRLITMKANSRLHGYGLKSVANTLKKYDGDSDWTYDEEKHEFITTLMIK